MPSIKDLYAIDPQGSNWTVPQTFDANFNWDYDDGRDAMIRPSAFLSGCRTVLFQNSTP